MTKNSQTPDLTITHLSREATIEVENWLSAAHISIGFMFRGIRSSGAITESLCESRVSRYYKALARQAGLDELSVQSISGHSMRVGGAHDLLTIGASLPQIMVKGGWAKTDTVMRYVERVRPSVRHSIPLYHLQKGEP